PLPLWKRPELYVEKPTPISILFTQQDNERGKYRLLIGPLFPFSDENEGLHEPVGYKIGTDKINHFGEKFKEMLPGSTVEVKKTRENPKYYKNDSFDVTI